MYILDIYTYNLMSPFISKTNVWFIKIAYLITQVQLLCESIK